MNNVDRYMICLMFGIVYVKVSGVNGLYSLGITVIMFLSWTTWIWLNHKLEKKIAETTK